MVQVQYYFEGEALRIRLINLRGEGVRDFISGSDGVLEDFDNDFESETPEEFMMDCEFWDVDFHQPNVYCWRAFEAAYGYLEDTGVIDTFIEAVSAK